MSTFSVLRNHPILHNCDKLRDDWLKLTPRRFFRRYKRRAIIALKSGLNLVGVTDSFILSDDELWDAFKLACPVLSQRPDYIKSVIGRKWQKITYGRAFQLTFQVAATSNYRPLSPYSLATHSAILNYHAFPARAADVDCDKALKGTSQDYQVFDDLDRLGILELHGRTSAGGAKNVCTYSQGTQTLPLYASLGHALFENREERKLLLEAYRFDTLLIGRYKQRSKYKHGKDCIDYITRPVTLSRAMLQDVDMRVAHPSFAKTCQLQAQARQANVISNKVANAYVAANQKLNHCLDYFKYLNFTHGDLHARNELIKFTGDSKGENINWKSLLAKRIQAELGYINRDVYADQYTWFEIAFSRITRDFPSLRERYKDHRRFERQRKKPALFAHA